MASTATTVATVAGTASETMKVIFYIGVALLTVLLISLFALLYIRSPFIFSIVLLIVLTAIGVSFIVIFHQLYVKDASNKNLYGMVSSSLITAGSLLTIIYLIVQHSIGSSSNFDVNYVNPVPLPLPLPAYAPDAPDAPETPDASYHDGSTGSVVRSATQPTQASRFLNRSSRKIDENASDVSL